MLIKTKERAMSEFNAIVGQSGGPTCAINATLSGVIRACLESGKINRLYGMKNGIEGLLRDDIVDLFSFFEDERDLEALELTPASALGTCRLCLPSLGTDESRYEKIVSVLKKHSIRYFFYIGGNDSMDTVDKLSQYVAKNSLDIVVVGVPKTIDNDLVITDHTPGYGSACKYIATTLKEIIRDCAVYTQRAVTIVEIMGRDSGWLTASASLCALDGKGVDLFYFPERAFDNDQFISDVERVLGDHNDVVVAISEGIRYSDGEYVCHNNSVDAFGNRQLCGSAIALASLVKGRLGCKTRAIELNVPQRCASHLSSKTDIEESVLIGKEAVKLALDGKNGTVPVFVRAHGDYKIELSYANACDVANKVKFVPDSFIGEDECLATKECVKYVLPSIQGERFPEFKNGLPHQIIIK
jgi:6-phosphofructokinase 1